MVMPCCQRQSSQSDDTSPPALKLASWTFSVLGAKVAVHWMHVCWLPDPGTVKAPLPTTLSPYWPSGRATFPARIVVAELPSKRRLQQLLKISEFITTCSPG